MNPAIEHWWGRDGLAHHIPILSTFRTACGRVLLFRGHDFTRFNPKTGEPWAKCGQCQRALERRTGKIAAPHSSEASSTVKSKGSE